MIRKLFSPKQHLGAFLGVCLIMFMLEVPALCAVNVQLLWDASTTPGIAGYNVYRSSTSGGPYTKLNMLFVTATTYTDMNAPNQIFFYVVRTVNGSGIESTNSNELRVDLTAPAPPTNLRLGGITTVQLFVNGTQVANGPPPINYIIPRITPPQAFQVRVTGQ